MKKHYWAFVILLIIIMLARYTVYNESDGANKYNSNSSDKYNDVISIATYTKNQYDSGSLPLETVIQKDNLDNFEKDENILQIFSSDQYFYKSAMSDKDTVIIQKSVVFHSVTGYVATKKKNLDTIDDKSFINPILNIPSCLGYDGYIVWIENDLGKFADWYLYRYSAGL